MRKPFLLLVVLFLSGCVGGRYVFYQSPDNPEQIPTGVYENAGVEVEIRNLETNTPYPTYTNVPSNTPVASSTATGTPTSTSTHTLTPTSTLTPEIRPSVTPGVVCRGTVVTTVNLNVRSVPLGNIVDRLAPGTEVEIVRFRVVQGNEWAELSNGWAVSQLGTETYIEYPIDVHSPEGLACLAVPYEDPTLPTAPPSRTPSITPELPTNTPEQTATPVNTAVFVTPTPDTGITITPGPTTEAGCTMYAVTNVRIRSGPSLNSPQVGLWPARNTKIISEFVVDNGFMWARIPEGYSAAYDYNAPANEAWLLESYGAMSEQCQDTPGWDQNLVPPEPIVENPNPRGLHLIYSANRDVVARYLSKIGTIKATDGTEWALQLAKETDPSITTVYRALYTPIGKYDCPPNWGVGDPNAAADAWYDLLLPLWSSRNTREYTDYYEYRNECRFVGAWEVVFDSRMVQRANQSGICLLLFSDAPGTPEIAEFIQRRPVLDLVLSQECQPGRYHAVALHVYFGHDSGAWLFGRWQLFKQSLGAKYSPINYWFTEYGLPNTRGEYEGRGEPDCAAIFTEMDAIDMIYRSEPEVRGYHGYSVGHGTEWMDITPCL